MEFSLESGVVQDDAGLLEAARVAWEAHPLRSERIDQAMGRCIVVVRVGEAASINADDFPHVALNVGPAGSADQWRFAVLTHELTHLLDRCDCEFTTGRMPAEISDAIRRLPAETFWSVPRAFHSYWNAYIDGRLERRGVHVESFLDRLHDKIGTTRWKRQLFSAAEVASLANVWESESQTFDTLVKAAEEHPYYRPFR